MYERALAGKERMLSVEDPSTLWAVNNMAILEQSRRPRRRRRAEAALRLLVPGIYFLRRM